MTMVYETRKVVEDYVLFKIKQHFTETDEVSRTDHVQQRFPVNGHGLFPLPQEPPSEINSAVRNVASEFEKRYKAKYPSLLEGLRANHTASSNIDEVFSRITKDLFQIPVNNKNKGKRPLSSSPSGRRKAMAPSPALVESDSVASSANNFGQSEYNHVNWGHVIGLLVFTGILSVRCVEINNNERVDEIVNWVSEYLDSELGLWLQHHGGWNGFAQWYQESKGSISSSWFDQYPAQDLRTVLKVSGAVAAFALGFVMLSRK